MVSIPNWSRVYAGKVHDVYAPIHALAHSGNEVLMLVTTDRVSVLDRVLPITVPGKGAVVNSISKWWFKQLADVANNHYFSDDVPPPLKERAIVVQRLRMYPIECTVVGYMTRPVYASYEVNGEFQGVPLPAGLRVGDRLPEPIFCPAIKAEVDSDDEPISFEQMEQILGSQVAERLRDMSIELYRAANEIVAPKGLTIADAKLEFGSSSDYGDDEFVFADQAFTPDSATYWISEEAEKGNPRTFGKDYVREAIEDEVLAWVSGASSQLHVPEQVLEEAGSRYRHVESVIFDR